MSGDLAAMGNAAMAAPGVTEVLLFEEQWGVLRFVVDGGDDAVVAAMIDAVIPVVYKTIGDVAVSMGTMWDGGPERVIRFSRPIDVTWRQL